MHSDARARALLVDPHPVVRDGLSRILVDAIGPLEVGEAGTRAEALRASRAAPWDLVVLELSIAGGGGLPLLEDLLRVQPRQPVLVTSALADAPYAARCLRAGAAGYVSKAQPASDFVEAARTVLAGRRYIGAALAQELATRWFDAGTRSPHDALSDRELQVLTLLARGDSVRQIASDLHLSDKTVSTYRARIREKLGLRTATELVRYAIRAELVD